MMKQLEINIPKLPYALEEAMNRLRVNIKFCGDQTRKLMVTSRVPNEGKSFVSVHLWEMLAKMGMPSVLVDIDLRKSVIEEDYHYLYSGELKGLDHYLSGISEEEEIIYHTNIENGDIIPVANHLENPSTLLEDPRMKKLLESLAEKYRYVILDTPPLQSVSDGNLITALSDGVILVVRGESTSKKLVRNSLHQIESCNGRLLGMVLNRVKIDQHAYYKYYGEYGEYK